jgi:glycosylphosphatidylinositol transamidase (GPIT) subunit GPI8
MMRRLSYRSHSNKGMMVKTIVFLIMIMIALLHTGFVPGGVGTTQAQVGGDSLYAVLYNGSSGYYIYMNTLKFAFKTLINDFGFTKENIVVISYSGASYDLDGQAPNNDIDFSATTENVDTIFARLKRVMTNGDVLFFLATDHGRCDTNDDSEAGLAMYQDADTLWEEELAAYIGSLDTPTRRITKILLFNTCYAGGMITPTPSTGLRPCMEALQMVRA